MDSQDFAKIMIVFVTSAAVCSVFLNFLLLVKEELKKCSIINKKKNYAVLIPSERVC